MMRELANESESESADGIFQQLLDELDDVVVIRAAETGKTLAVNDAVEDVFGYTSAEFRSLDIADYTAGPNSPDEARAQEAYETARKVGSATFLWRAERHDGDPFWAEVNVSQTMIDDQEYLVSVIRDITKYKTREIELERLASVLSHDLRNPLNAAKAQTTHLREQTGCQNEFVDRLEDLHDRMLNIVDDVLTAVTEDQQITDIESIHLDSIVNDAWKIVGGDGKLKLRDNLGVIEADRHRLQRLFENLFENAIVHSDETVTVTVSKIDGGILISDDGPGIPEDDRDQVLKYGYTTAESGTGLGLNIVSTIADAHGWELTVGESVDGGAQFRLTGISRNHSDEDNINPTRSSSSWSEKIDDHSHEQE
ncbi:sensor histidine kinase [Haloquadratum walsbyi]|jgi:PAS domain S-box-containing protein|uniref:sensor histidine kinase n=1 Tax=Haloquadratum walsbyi TaxID=293091 RepID=UPI0015F65FD0|nr:PAS domain-containing sensor histidine kinase [Haloquadratum walsbyi]